jgi:hypothetical protein
MNHDAMWNDLQSRGAFPSYITGSTNAAMKQKLRDILGGDQCIPAVIGLHSVAEAEERLSMSIFARAQLCDDGLHDGKGLFKALMDLIYLHSSKDQRIAILDGLKSIGEGTKQGLKGRDLRKIMAAYGLVYASSSVLHRTIVKTMSMLHSCGMYLKPEKRRASHIVLYALLATRLEVLMEEAFGNDESGAPLDASAKIPKSPLTAGGLFGRYYKAVVSDNVTRGWLDSLWHGLTERDEELFAKIKNWIHKNFSGAHVTRSVLENVLLRSAFHDCYKRSFTQWKQRADSEGNISQLFMQSMEQDTDEPGLQATWLKCHVPTAQDLASDAFGIFLIHFCCLYVSSGTQVFKRLPGVLPEPTPNGRVVKLISIDLTAVEEVLDRYHSWFDTVSSMKEDIVQNVFKPLVWDKLLADKESGWTRKSAPTIPSWGAKQLYDFIAGSDKLRALVGMPAEAAGPAPDLVSASAVVDVDDAIGGDGAAAAAAAAAAVAALAAAVAIAVAALAVLQQQLQNDFDSRFGVSTGAWAG